jgi:hypothetical protein
MLPLVHHVPLDLPLLFLLGIMLRILLVPSIPKFHLRYHWGIIPLLVMFPHLPRSSLEGLVHLFMEDLALVVPIQLVALIIYSLPVTRFPLGGNLMPKGNLNLGVTLKLGCLLHMEDILKIELIIHNLDRTRQNF